jgi:serine/threonine-protein phosphatase PP1 catalytic subunit
MEDDKKNKNKKKKKEKKKKKKKEKKGKKFKKKQKREEEKRKRQEELLKEKEQNEMKENEKNEESKDKDGNENEVEEKQNENEEGKEKCEDIDTSSKKLNEENDDGNNNSNNDANNNEINTNSTKDDNKEEDEKDEDDNNIINDNEDEDNEDNERNKNDNISKFIEKLKKARKGAICQELSIKEGECDYIIDKAYDILKKEDSMLKISAPLYICGDIHGQYYDLLRVFDILKYPPKSKFLFLGDYVDRGKQSLECLLLLLCLKIKYPSSIFLLRGNHESEALNKIYGFYDECKRRISVKCFKKITNLFNILPITALIDENILCMHGGLSKDLTKIEQLDKILRPTEIPDDGLLCDLVWSDPSDVLSDNFGENERNVSVTFSKNVVEEFTKNNGLDLICRAHQVVEEGFQFFAGMKLVTIFTAPNYMGEFDNNGGILEVGEDLLCKIHGLKPNIERKGKRKRITELVN